MRVRLDRLLVHLVRHEVRDALAERVLRDASGPEHEIRGDIMLGHLACSRVLRRVNDAVVMYGVHPASLSDQYEDASIWRVNVPSVDDDIDFVL